MRSFLLNLNTNSSIALFSLPHIILITVTLVLTFLIILKRKKIAEINPKIKKIIRITFGLILFINFVIRRGSFIYYGVYDWRHHLDINFCNFTSILFILYCFSGNKKILNISYHMAFIGPLLAIVLPSYNLLPYGYAFYSFLIIHHAVFLFALFSIFMDKLKWQKENSYSVIKFLIVYYTVVLTFDYFFKVDYNLPLTFINTSITKITFINYIVANSLVAYSIYILMVMILFLFGDYILKRFSKMD